MLFGNKELDKTFIDGQTTFMLSSAPNEGGDTFQNILCTLIKTIKYKRENWYLIETEQDFTGLDFGIEAVRINKFFIVIRHHSNFERNKKNDVIIYLPNDVNDPLSSTETLSEMKVIEWAYIYNIEVSRS